jgi:hypothetical protein
MTVEQRAPTRATIGQAIAHALDLAQARIDDAYWRFTRQARAKPPCLVVPDAYEARTILQKRLITIRLGKVEREPARGWRR